MKPCLFATERLVLPLIPHSISAPHKLMAVWQHAPENGLVMAHPDAISVPLDAWSAAVSIGHRTWHQKAASLEVLVPQFFTQCLPVAKAWPACLDFKDRALEIALFLPDAQFKVFELVCLPQWSRQDVEAECWLEAAQRMQLNMAYLVLDFQVSLAPNGQLRATAMVCEKQDVQIYEQQFLQWGLKLAIISSHSQARAL